MLSALDVSVRGPVTAMMRRVPEELGIAYLFISHETWRWSSA